MTGLRIGVVLASLFLIAPPVAAQYVARSAFAATPSITTTAVAMIRDSRRQRKARW
jgi:hypothetical protein